MVLRLKIEDYVYNSAGDGFSLNTIVQADFRDKSPSPSTGKPLINFKVTQDKAISELTEVGQT